jgi:DNA-binding MarR family transcriptional regulator
MEEIPHLGNKAIIFSNQVKHYLHHIAEAEGISGSQSRILHILSKQPADQPLFQKDIEEIFHLRRSTVAQTIQTMEKHGLLVRSSVAEDARLKKLTITEQGRELEDRIGARILKMEEHLCQNLTDNEIETYLAVMEKMSASMAEIGSQRELHQSENLVELCQTEKGEISC